MTALRIAVIGLGQRIAHVLGALKDVEPGVAVAGYSDPTPVGLPILADKFDIDPGLAHADEKALLDAGPFDLVMIGSPNHLHYAHLLSAFEAGTPIFCEKPVVRDDTQSFALARRLARGDTPPLFVGLVMRSVPLVREVLRHIDGGALGQIVSIDATEHLPPEHGAYLARNWRRKTEWGGSFLLDKVCHDFDILGRIAGARPARVASFGGRRIFTPARADAPRTYRDGSAAYARIGGGWMGANDAFHSDMDVTDHQVALVEYENGVRLSFHANSHVGLMERRWYVAGTEGTLIADHVRGTVMMRRVLDTKKPERLAWAHDPNDQHGGADHAMARDLLATLRDGAPFPVTPDESLRAGLTIMAIDRAMETGAVVDCAPMWADYDAAWGRILMV